MIDHDHVSGASFGPGYPATPEPVPVSALREGIPSANDFLHTDRGIMSFSQFVGLSVAAALRERGLWRDGDPADDPALIVDRMRDMATISRATIGAMHDWHAQAIEARSGETRQRLDPTDESAVAKPCAPNPDQSKDTNNV